MRGVTIRLEVSQNDWHRRSGIYETNFYYLSIGARVAVSSGVYLTKMVKRRNIKENSYGQLDDLLKRRLVRWNRY